MTQQRLLHRQQNVADRCSTVTVVHNSAQYQSIHVLKSDRARMHLYLTLVYTGNELDTVISVPEYRLISRPMIPVRILWKRRRSRMPCDALNQTPFRDQHRLRAFPVSVPLVREVLEYSQ